MRKLRFAALALSLTALGARPAEARCRRVPVTCYCRPAEPQYQARVESPRTCYGAVGETVYGPYTVEEFNSYVAQRYFDHVWDGENWWPVGDAKYMVVAKVDGRVYGPYTREQAVHYRDRITHVWWAGQRDWIVVTPEPPPTPETPSEGPPVPSYRAEQRLIDSGVAPSHVESIDSLPPEARPPVHKESTGKLETTGPADASVRETPAVEPNVKETVAPRTQSPPEIKEVAPPTPVHSKGPEEAPPTPPDKRDTVPYTASVSPAGEVGAVKLSAAVSLTSSDLTVLEGSDGRAAHTSTVTRTSRAADQTAPGASVPMHHEQLIPVQFQNARYTLSPSRLVAEWRHDTDLRQQAVRVDGCDLDLWPAEKRLFEAVNRQRLVNGRASLVIDAHLVLQARDWAWKMSQGAVGFGHSGEGAENIAYDSSGESVEKLMIQWMKSPGHRANILNKSYRRFGGGMFGNYGVQRFE